MATTFVAIAQDKKPTKEETIAFMNSTLNKTIGFDGKDGIINEVIFTGNSYFLKGYEELIDGIFTKKYTQINWELDPDGFTINDNCLRVKFTSNFSLKQKVKDQPEEEFFFADIDFLLPIEKIESFKKACLRLSELAKEENKDPFEK